MLRMFFIRTNFG